MSQVPRICPRCGGLLTMTPGALAVQCSRCATRYRLRKKKHKCAAGSPEQDTSLGPVSRPPIPLALSGRNQRQAAVPTATPAVPAISSRRRRPKPYRAIFVAVTVSVLVVSGVFALVLAHSRKQLEQRRAAQPAEKKVAKSAPTEPEEPTLPPPPGFLSKELEKRREAGTAAGRRPSKVESKLARQIYEVASLDSAPSIDAAEQIDALVFSRLKSEGITPASPCSDEVFLRRVYIDVIGTLPTAEEAKAFLKSKDPARRRKLIDKLLEREEFADYWAMKWSDMLRVKSEFPINLWPNAVRAYHHWIRTAIRKNMPYDQFARALLTSSGSNFRNPPVNFYRALQSTEPKNIAYAAGLTFMGVRPEGLPSEKWAELSTFFCRVGYKGTREWKEEVVFFDPRKPLKASKATLPDGTEVSISPNDDPRFAFADWLITPDNRWFNRAIANRVWCWLLGRGIIHEPDDIRSGNPPSNPELLAHLEKELVASGYDLKHLYRMILNSRTYQLSCISRSEHPKAAALFASYPVRRLEAEVLIDAICQITRTRESYFSPIPEPFTYLPQGSRSICIPDASITSPFLEMFGRPPRDTGLYSERSNKFTSAQRLHLVNSSHIMKKIQKGPGLMELIKSRKDEEKVIEDLYVTILSRYPTQKEVNVATSHAWDHDGLVEVAWALINSSEFLCRH